MIRRRRRRRSIRRSSIGSSSSSIVVVGSVICMDVGKTVCFAEISLAGLLDEGGVVAVVIRIGWERVTHCK